ncbi:MAG: DoxX family protein [Candidatus Pedobacter colombiensis]|uniref:DoxX family protein n=1 Tax=Candidatus Pedobacter colombiensis TaxID=3121371 RepID=A0AAJ5WFK8_9SPHI|nr:DoxX family protein [Pedobacter sp.]WEK21672.1 MAG: DoxX family protein [Pedobacter sp.]
MNNLFKVSPVPTIYARVIVGLIFLSEGIQKFIRPDEVGAGRFLKIGFHDAAFWAHFTGVFEILCGLLLLLGLLTRVATIPLLVIMIVAFITTKYPILIDKGFWSMAHEYRTDFAMTILLIFLLKYGGGKNSIDHLIYYAKKQE